MLQMYNLARYLAIQVDRCKILDNICLRKIIAKLSGPILMGLANIVDLSSSAAKKSNVLQRGCVVIYLRNHQIINETILCQFPYPGNPNEELQITGLTRIHTSKPIYYEVEDI